MPRLKRRGHSKRQTFERALVRWLRYTDRPFWNGPHCFGVRTGPDSASIIDYAENRRYGVVLVGGENAKG